MNRPRKARVEGEASVSVARPSVGFRGAVTAFREAHPDRWEELRLCPLEHGLEVMAEALEKL